MSKRSPETPAAGLHPLAALVTALLVPGLGHVLQGQRARGIAFFGLVVGSLGVGLAIGGRLPWEFSGAPLPRLATVGTLGAGLPVILARLVFGYEADPTGAGFEYGGAFILTAGLMNLLLMLDSWDIAHGRDPMPTDDGGSEPTEKGEGGGGKGQAEDGASQREEAQEKRTKGRAKSAKKKAARGRQKKGNR
ncbi:MAG: hypothetical protein MI919_38555 [Holophagales bacterium]|nr:hypothetical protein [Holophagales bacterium]